MLIGYILIFGFIVIDQLVKLLSTIFKVSDGTLIKTLIPKVLEFHYLENTGASFGMFEDAQFVFGIVTIISLIIFGYLFYDANFKTKKTYSLSIVFIIAGTFGNAIDRLFRNGAVIDMFNMPVLNNILGVVGVPDFIFNIADLYMTLGIILFIVDILFLERKRVDKNDKIIEEIDA